MRMIFRIELSIETETGEVKVISLSKQLEGQPLKAAPASAIPTVRPLIDTGVSNVVAPTRVEGRLLEQLLGLGLEEQYVADILKIHSMDRLGKLAAWVLRIKATQGATDPAQLFRVTLAKSAGTAKR